MTKFVATITAEIELNGANADYISGIIESSIKTMISNGGLTGHTEAEVESHDVSIIKGVTFNRVNSLDTFLIEVASHAKPGCEMISDVRLFNKINPSGKNAQFAILQTIIEDQIYTLQLSGQLSLYTVSSSKLVFNGNGFNEEIINSIENSTIYIHDFEVTSAPWFEWINEAGDPVCDVMDNIFLDPALNVKKLKQALA